MARKFSLTFIIIGIIGIISIDKLLDIFFKNNEISQQGPFALGIFFMILTGIILYFIINNMEKVVQKIDKSYKELQKKDKSRIAPYEFSLDNSVDSIHWLSLDGKFLYVNEATCRMEGYTKEEFQNMYLYDIDPNFDKESAKECMLDIKNTENWRLESTHLNLKTHHLCYMNYLCDQ